MKGKKRTIICSTVVLFGIWQAASLLIGYSFILPSPLTVLGRMAHLPLEQSFYTAIGATTLRALLGLLLAMGLGERSLRSPGSISDLPICLRRCCC
ncbi:MAG: hypothetical protein ACLVJ6_00525 [Merdibacter sp.]